MTYRRPQSKASPNKRIVHAGSPARSFQKGFTLIEVLIASVVAPRVDQGHRATLLSLNSLAGRLGYGLILLAVSDVAADEVQKVLGWFSVISWVMVVVLLVTVMVVPRSIRTDSRVSASV